MNQPASEEIKVMPLKDGGWWETVQATERDCTTCQQTSIERPVVMAYVEGLDPLGEQRNDHAGWSFQGWLIWWECSHCGETTYQVTVPEHILTWGQELGGWRPNL